jgi:dipeptidyl aminopeptidase/acylaminoacyl peptidase
VIQADRRYYEDVDQPYTFGAPIWKAEHQVIENSPIHRLGSATTPLLLIEGEFDASPREMEAVFSILYGRGVPVELAYYWGETHIINSPGNIKDIWQRTEAFFRRYLRTH